MREAALVYVSITGLRIKGPLHVAAFWWHAVRSMVQAQRSPGILKAEARSISGVQHTLTVWQDKASMRRFLISGAHARAMRAFPSIASGGTFGFESTSVPAWAEIHEIWCANAVTYVADNKRL